MSNDPITGPIPRSEFAEIVVAPFGEAAKRIRKYDPFWGLKEGEEIEWRVTVERDIRETGIATVRAATQKEAEKLADAIPDNEFIWDVDCGPGDIISLFVEPKGQR